jgi:poly(A) polymerase
LFYDPEASQVLDFVGGQKDLEQGLIRAIGQPDERFAEDKLRLLRAVRFAVRYGFKIESDTQRAIEQMADQVGAVSVERITMELRLILLHPDRAQGVQLLDEVGLLKAIMQKAGVDWQTQEPAGGDDWSVTLDVLAQLHEPSFPLALAALVHRLLPGEIAKLAINLKLSTAETRRAAWLVLNYQQLLEAESLKWPQLQRLLVDEGSAELLALADAIVQSTKADSSGVEYCRLKLKLPPDELNPSPLLTGDDLVAHGIRPGPDFQLLLQAVRDAQLDGAISTKTQALEFVDKLRASDGPRDKSG